MKGPALHGLRDPAHASGFFCWLSSLVHLSGPRLPPGHKLQELPPRNRSPFPLLLPAASLLNGCRRLTPATRVRFAASSASILRRLLLGGSLPKSVRLWTLSSTAPPAAWSPITSTGLRILKSRCWHGQT